MILNAGVDATNILLVGLFDWEKPLLEAGWKSLGCLSKFKIGLHVSFPNTEREEYYIKCKIQYLVVFNT